MTVNCIKLLLIREYTVLLATKRSLSTDIFDLVRGMASSSSKKKNTSHTDQIIKSKKIIKDQGQQLGISSRINLQVVANGYAGTKKSVLLSTDQTNYLFNCGESTQRILTEKNGWDMKFSKISQLFVTRKSWDTLGGIVGLCISLKESKSTDITFHAPCDMLDLLKHWKGLDGFPNMTIDQHDYQKADFIDSNFKIRAIPLRSTNFFTHQENKRQRLTSDNDLADFQLYPHDLVYAYLCETQPYPSTLSPELCAFHGVPFNHLRTQLKNGEDVTLENGRIIRSVDVVLPVEPPVKVLVLDCPSLCYMDAIEKSEINNHKYHAIIHMTSHDLLTNAAYRSEMKKMNTTHHIFLDENQKNVHSDALYRYQSQLNYIDDGLFPLLSYQTILKEGIALPAPIDNISQGITSTRISLRPVLGPDNSKQYLVQPEVNIEAMLENEQFKETFEAVKQQITAMHEIAKTGHSIPEIVFLGTGSACPSKPRNISGILIHINSTCSMILDCGEGTIGQIHRFYGEQTNEILSQIKLIFISHMHSDHLGGLYGLIRARRQAFEHLQLPYENVLLLCPNKLSEVGRRQWSFFNEHEFQDDVTLVYNRSLTNGTLALNDSEKLTDNDKEMEKYLLKTLEHIGMKLIQTVLVEHIYDAHAVVLKHIDGWSLAFSGDCRPSLDFIKAGQNCDVLIHEATYEDGLEIYASQMRHCTMSQAVDVGKQMNAKFIILWHFSQRYAKVPYMKRTPDLKLENVCLSFDNMRIKLSDLPRACKLTGTFESLFIKEQVLYERRSQRRERDPEVLMNNERINSQNKRRDQRYAVPTQQSTDVVQEKPREQESVNEPHESESVKQRIVVSSTT